MNIIATRLAISNLFRTLSSRYGKKFKECSLVPYILEDSDNGNLILDFRYNSRSVMSLTSAVSVDTAVIEFTSSIVFASVPTGPWACFKFMPVDNISCLDARFSAMFDRIIKSLSYIPVSSYYAVSVDSSQTLSSVKPKLSTGGSQC